jgi:hypothetical protein
MKWKYFKSAEEAKEFIANLLNENFRKYVKWDVDVDSELIARLIVSIDMFQERYYGFVTGEDMLLGYAVVDRTNDIRVKALIARGITDVWVETIDIEEWLGEHRYDDDP